MARTGRRPGSSGTRERISASARQAFAESGFEGATIRSIAGRAGVDPALVHHYFGSKEELFVATMQLPFDPQRLAEMLAAGGLDGIGERLIRFAVGVWRQPGLQLVVQGIARSATSDERAAASLRRLLETTLLPAVRRLGVDHPDLRASLLWAQIMGVIFGRFVVRVTPIAEADPEEMVRLLAPALQAVMTAPLPASVAPPASGLEVTGAAVREGAAAGASAAVAPKARASIG